ncbi:MAG TPA: flagellar hook-basal body complex protein FliE [Stellaceae bacterium]|nr:flagellar hook-basal body complex protein FliE [Stellaceae bacterium]
MPSINFSDAVNAYQSAARAVTGPSAPTAGADKNFGDMLRAAAGNVVDTISKGEQASLQAATGTADLTAVTAAVNNAEVAVQTVAAIRDRVIAAYQDIMRMPI